LHRVLNMPWGKVHEHAERLEHATNHELANFLDDYLGNPSFDPHGHPIPNADGSVEEVERLRLTAIPSQTSAEVVQCTNENAALLDYLNSLGLVPGARVVVQEQAPFNGPLTVAINGNTQLVGAEAARTLLVRISE
jgi:DtxR family Mn-dependent transcriptional regulator